MLSKVESVTGQYIDPVVFKSGQYLQSVLLQKLNPRSLFEDPTLGVVVDTVAGVNCMVEEAVMCPLKSAFLALVKKSVMRL